ncbi:MAG: polysaccharide pyruvyl transferase family protein [Sphaerochaeta sp.]|jgi:hypothetical protein|nr:polysaccharide pyruvyl transferase family protein [Sphaerochaeta sp.]
MIRLRAFWHLDPHNFGDTLTEWLLKRYGAEITRAAPADADLFAVGSVLDVAPTNYAGIVWGTGLIRDIPRPLPHASSLAVRGRLTASHIGHPNADLGDPGLLLPRHIHRAPTTHPLGVVPHKIHVDHHIITHLREDPNILIIDPREPVDIVVANITSCSAILATSLHGLITADAYNIPACWADLPDKPLAGSRDFKFYDHETAILDNGTPNRRVQLTPDTTIGDILLTVCKANPELVARSVDNLHTTITETLRTWTT